VWRVLRLAVAEESLQCADASRCRCALDLDRFAR